MEINYIRSVCRRIRNIFLMTSALLILSVVSIFSQTKREEAPPFKERLFYGGSFGLQFGSYTDIEVAPVIGYWLLPRLAIAAGPDYRFYKDPNNMTAIYGGSSYIQFVVIKDLSSFIPMGSHTGFFLHVEDELLSLKSSFWKDPPYPSDRFFINTILAGGGITQQVGRRSSFNVMVLWALDVPQYNLYGNPEFRVSFIF